MSVKKFLKSIKFPGLDSVYEVPVTSVNGMTGDVEVSEMLNPIPYDYMPEGYPKIVPTGGDTLTWDGNTEGRVSAGPFCKVSDAIVTLSDIVSGVTVVVSGDSMTVAKEQIEEMASGVLFAEAVVFVEEKAVGVDIMGIAFPGSGIYFQTDVSSLTIPGYTGFPGIKKIDAKYLPEGYPKKEVITIKKEGSDVALKNFPDFAVGDTVTVTVDGVEYSLVAFDNGIPTIGDTYDELEQGNGAYGWQICSYSEEICFYANEIRTVSYQYVVISPMDEKFLPDSVKSGGGLVITNDEDGNYLANMSFDEAYAAIASGVMPVYISSEDGIGTVFRCAGIRLKPGTYIRMDFESSLSSGGKVMIRYDNDGIGLDMPT